MADTMLDKYLRRQKEFEQAFKQNGATESGMWMYQELLYRIDVLQAIQMYSTVAPVSSKTGVLMTHYHMLDSYLNNLVFERQYGLPVRDDDDMVKHRQAAHTNLCRVIESYRKRFSSFTPGEPDQYKREINKAILTVLPAWIQYRNVYVPIKNSEEA